MAQAVPQLRASWIALSGWIACVVLLAAASAAAMFPDNWLPLVQSRVSGATVEAASKTATEDDHAGGGHDHGHDGHEESNSIELSEQARKNIGLKTEKVQLTAFTRTVSVPGIVVEQPGRSMVKVTTPMTGIITRIFPIEGECAQPGEPLFELRLTHEEIVRAQTDLLRSAEELDVIAREITRLEKVTADGAIAGKTLLERKYEQQKLSVANRAQQQALLLHGLSPEQVDAILKTRSLLQKITIVAPTPETMAHAEA